MKKISNCITDDTKTGNKGGLVKLLGRNMFCYDFSTLFKVFINFLCVVSMQFAPLIVRSRGR